MPGKVLAADVVKLDKAKTVQGQEVSIVAGKDGVTVDKAKVVKTDIEAKNGVIHVIDTVILPKVVISEVSGTPADRAEVARPPRTAGLLIE